MVGSLENNGLLLQIRGKLLDKRLEWFLESTQSRLGNDPERRAEALIDIGSDESGDFHMVC